MARQIRSDITVKNLVKKYGVPKEALRHPNGRAMRSDKTLGSIRKDAAKIVKAN